MHCPHPDRQAHSHEKMSYITGPCAPVGHHHTLLAAKEYLFASVASYATIQGLGVGQRHKWALNAGLIRDTPRINIQEKGWKQRIVHILKQNEREWCRSRAER